MAKKIVEYTAKELPSGMTDQAQQPYLPAPVLKSQTQGDQVAKSVSSALTDVAESAMIIQNHNEAIVGNKIYNEFDIEQTNKLLEMKKQYQGDKALRVGDQKGFTQLYEDQAKEAVDERVNNSDLSPWAKDALKRTLYESLRGKLHQAATYEQEQQVAVAGNNVYYDLGAKFNQIKAGAVKTDEEFDKMVNSHNAVIEVNMPGNESKKLLDREALATERFKYEKSNRERVAFNQHIANNTDKFGIIDTDKAFKEAMDPTNPINKELSVDQMKGNAHAIRLIQSQYEKQDEERKDRLIVDFLGGKLRKDDLLGNADFLKMRPGNKSMIVRFVDAQERAERAEQSADRAEKRVERQEQRINWQNNADQVYGDVLGKIAEGKYSNTTQIYNEMIDASQKDENNPYILKKASEVMGIFNKIESSPDLRDGLKRINDAEKTGIFQKLDKENPLGAAASMRGKLRQMYMTDPTFREEKINQWLNEQLKDKAKSGVGAFLNQVFTPRSQAEAAAINDTYGGNQATPDTVTVNGTTYKVGDTYNGYRYIGGGKWEK